MDRLQSLHRDIESRIQQARRGHGSLLQARILMFIEAGITAESDIDARCRLACVQELASAIPDRARGTYVPPVAPPRIPNSDWRCFPSLMGGKQVEYRPHV